uniref:Reverse transcriptase domain-containing protein n=1 Tax=Astyanax mexicanus TaxID=7994 RepID=A0A3B1IGL0_ASTMX
MAPHMAASVQCSLFVILFLFIFVDTSNAHRIMFSREELLSIKQQTPVTISPNFIEPQCFLELLIGGTAIVCGRRKRRRGKRAGILVRLRQRGFRMALPAMHLANVRSLPNKMDELLLLNKTNRDFYSSAALCFTETWLSELIPDNGLHLPEFCLHRADRQKELSGKMKGGGICFYINKGWCTDVTVVSKYCSPNLESLFLNCKPFYSPREFSSFILAGVYVPPQADVSNALQTLSDLVNLSELKYPDSLLIIMGDFNRAKLNHELPKFRQHINCPTRDNNILDHCYTVLKGAYHSVPRAALGHSDHCLIHLIPTYKQKVKSAKPVIRTVKKWTNEAKEELQDCFDCTDWSVFEDATGDLDVLTDTVTSYISFCEGMCVPTKTFRIFNNNKPWFTASLNQLRKAKEKAYSNGDRTLYKTLRNTLTKEIRAAKRNYSEKLKKRFSSNDSAALWRGLQDITSYKKPFPTAEAKKGLADDLNAFYCRFERGATTPLPPCGQTAVSTTHLDISPPVSQFKLNIREQDVCRLFQRQNVHKAPGPDGVTPSCLRSCAVQLAPIFTQIFNKSLELCKVPSCFKSSIIIPVPKKPSITGLNDYRPVALTSVVMKSFERMVLTHLKNISDHQLDALQFAYRANRSVDDAVNMGLHFILQHLDRPRTYVRILFLDFSSAFNTIIPEILIAKLSQLTISPAICQWIFSFLTDRRQHVRLKDDTSGVRTTNTGAPQGCVLSPLLFSLYTNDCTSNDPTVKLLKFADDTTIIGLIQDGDESAYRQEVDKLVLWCSQHNLELNTLKTVEMVVDFRKHPKVLHPVIISNSPVSNVDSYKFLGSIISRDLKWELNINAILKKAQQRMYFLRQLRKYGLPQELLATFYTAAIESILCTSITVWFGAATKQDKNRLQRTIRTAAKIIGTHLPSLQELYSGRIRKRAENIIKDPTHPAYTLFNLLPSGRRYRSLQTKTTRHKNSFFPMAITCLNC